jgi:hypothetical protein
MPCTSHPSASSSRGTIRPPAPCTQSSATRKRRARSAGRSRKGRARIASRCRSMAASSSVTPPSASQWARGSSSPVRKAWKRAMRSASRKVPSAPANLKAFHGAGLWLAVTPSAPAAPWWRTARRRVGVGTMPRRTTCTPTDWSPAVAAASNMAPLVRESRPRSTVTSPPPASRRRKAPNPPASVAMSSGVRTSPTMPRKPETLTMRPEGKRRGMGCRGRRSVGRSGRAGRRAGGPVAPTLKDVRHVPVGEPAPAPPSAANPGDRPQAAGA